MIVEKKERNMEIVLLKILGYSGAYIGRRFGVSRQRIRQIWVKHLRQKIGKDKVQGSGVNVKGGGSDEAG